MQTIVSLATKATRIAGVESPAVNSTTHDLYTIGRKITTGTRPTGMSASEHIPISAMEMNRCR